MQSKADGTLQSKFHQAGTLGEAQYCFPTTIAQQAFYTLDQLERGNPTFNVAVRFRIRGIVDTSVLERALNEIVQRHEILRATFFSEDDAILQVIHTGATIPLPVEDLSAPTLAERDHAVESSTHDEAARRFDLSAGPLIRARLLRIAADDHYLLITVHHIVSDGWSIGIISDELGVYYQAIVERRPAELPQLSLQFPDYAVWMQERTTGVFLEKSGKYWGEKLASLPRCEILPDRPRSRLRTHNGNILGIQLRVALTDLLTNYAHGLGSTFSVVSLAALVALIQRYTQQDDIVIGTILAGRDRLELEPLIGPFINTVVLRIDASGDPTFPELVKRVGKVMQEAMEHKDLHIQQVTELLRPKWDPSRPTLFNLHFIYQRDFIKPLEFCGITLQPSPSLSAGALYELSFFMVRRSTGWRLSLEYNTDLYELGTANRLIQQLENLFEQIAINPQRPISRLRVSPDIGYLSSGPRV